MAESSRLNNTLIARHDPHKKWERLSNQENGWEKNNEYTKGVQLHHYLLTFIVSFENPKQHGSKHLETSVACLQRPCIQRL